MNKIEKLIEKELNERNVITYTIDDPEIKGTVVIDVEGGIINRPAIQEFKTLLRDFFHTEKFSITVR